MSAPYHRVDFVHAHLHNEQPLRGLKRSLVPTSDSDRRFPLCRMLVDTPFPFPWAQLLVLFLLGYALSLPWLVVAFVDHAWAAASLTFFAVLTYWSTNEVRQRAHCSV